MSNQGPSPYPDLPAISITHSGLAKLLCGMNSHKASDLESVLTRLLKEVSKKISHVLTCLYQASINQGILPWTGIKPSSSLSSRKAPSGKPAITGRYHSHQRYVRHWCTSSIVTTSPSLKTWKSSVTINTNCERESHVTACSWWQLMTSPVTWAVGNL